MIISDDESEKTEEEDEEPEPVKPAPPMIQEDEEALSPSMLRALENRQALQKKLEDKKMEKMRQARREEEEARRLARLAELRKAQDEKEVSYLCAFSGDIDSQKLMFLNFNSD